jgi:molecular chaperone DnaJ
VDPERRQRYDTSGVTHSTTQVFSYGFEGFDFSVEAVHGHDASTFGDLFADVIRHEATGLAEGAERGADVHTGLAISFEDAMRGTERRVAIVRRDVCRTCRGSGILRAPEVRCGPCQGMGRVRSSRGHMVFSKSCPECGGTGRVRQTSCATCAGAGFEPRGELVRVVVRPGTPDGHLIRVDGLGNVGTRGGAAGDLLVAVQVAPHPVFRREGDDLHCTLPIAVHEAALGAKIEIPTFDGPARLRVPPGTQSGQRFRLRERGAPSARDGHRGDLVVEIRIALPPMLDERSKELLREFGRINNVDVRKGMGWS